MTSALRCRATRALVVMAGALALALPVPPHALPARAAAAAAPETLPLDMVVAVDESGSLSAGAVSREIEATSTIAQSVLNPQSRVTVIGFGSNNGRPGQNAVDQVCRPTVVGDGVSLQYLAECVKGLHRRTDEEGNDTDHVAALTQALATLRDGSPANALKVVFLLTDGHLDVPRSPAYGSGSESDPVVRQRRNEGAAQQLGDVIGQTQREGVQIWPLGFGAGVTQENLDRFAAGGSRAGCDARAESRPRARIVRDDRDVTRSLFEAYAAASCSGLTPTDSTTVEDGQVRELKVEIPLIATDGTITVSKSDPRVLAEFVDPRGRTVTTGTDGDSTFAHSGANTATEALRIVNPLNGTWTVRLKAPQRLSRRLVSATALWQGAVQATIVPEPPSARAGQEVRIRLSLVTRKGAITDEEALRGLTFSVTATGGGLAQPQTVQVRDDGSAPDDREHDGRYAGVFAAPRGPGDVTLTGVVAGIGIRAERVPTTVTVGSAETVVQGQIEFDGDGTVRQGEVVRGRVTVHNGASSPRRARLALRSVAGVRATPAPDGPVTLPPGDSTTPFAIGFGKDAALGGASVEVRLADDGDPAVAYASGLLTVTVERPPTWWETYRRYIAAAALVLLLAAVTLLMVRAARRRRVNVRGLSVALTLDGERTGAELKAPSSWSPRFRFALRGDTYAARLVPPRPGDDDQAFTVCRAGAGVTVETPEGDRYPLGMGVESEPLPSGHRLVFRDAAKRRGTTRRTGLRRPPDPATAVPEPGPDPGPDPGGEPRDREDSWQRTAPDYDSPWL
ncbi:vWA domain-containing protein [Nonomuraea sp. NPDC049684]|uniref:vWA domain-containing protein n=1 Tax=Nonomuraea sp. NPDC049684 TaxID=3364356 RepID=UPI003794788B